jgi:predicted RecA/RadA family phage recombinase
MRNYVQEGIVLTIVAPVAVKSGDLVLLGAIVGVCACDSEAGQEVEVRVEGVFSVPKLASADVLAAGALAKATFVNNIGAVGAAGSVDVGWITEASASGQTTVNVRLVPTV